MDSFIAYSDSGAPIAYQEDKLLSKPFFLAPQVEPHSGTEYTST